MFCVSILAGHRWLLGYPVTYLFRNGTAEAAIQNLSMHSLHFNRVYMCAEVVSQVWTIRRGTDEVKCIENFCYCHMTVFTTFLLHERKQKGTSVTCRSHTWYHYTCECIVSFLILVVSFSSLEWNLTWDLITNCYMVASFSVPSNLSTRHEEETWVRSSCDETKSELPRD
jgi:hypothetical protein